MTETRAFELTIEIPVPADAVWQALTSAEELVRWFPTEANITPGSGGRWVVSWDGNWQWSTEIEIWEPNRHLRLTDRSARPYDAEGKAVNQTVAPVPISIDWYLEGKGGSTSLRLVHSGFGRGSAWDDELEGVSTGWPFELNALKHYLQRHRGTDRQVAWTRSVVASTPDALWSRMTGRGGIVRDGTIAAPDGIAAVRPGPYAATLSTGDRLEGQVMATIPNRGIQLSVDAWNQAIFRIWVDRVGNESTVNAWLSTYGMPESFVKDFDRRMRAEIDRITTAAVA